MELHVLKYLLRVQRAELRPEQGGVSAIGDRGVAGRIEPELPQPAGSPVRLLHHPDRRRHVHELDRIVERGGGGSRQDAAALRRPPPVGTAHEHPPPGRRPKLNPVDFGRGLGHDAGRLEPEELPSRARAFELRTSRELSEGTENVYSRARAVGLLPSQLAIGILRAQTLSAPPDAEETTPGP